MDHNKSGEKPALGSLPPNGLRTGHTSMNEHDMDLLPPGTEDKTRSEATPYSNTTKDGDPASVSR